MKGVITQGQPHNGRWVTKFRMGLGVQRILIDGNSDSNSKVITLVPPNKYRGIELYPYGGPSTTRGYVGDYVAFRWTILVQRTDHCKACDGGKYAPAGSTACLPCGNGCPNGTYSGSACTPSSPATCLQCSSCPYGSYKTTECGTKSDTRCTACSDECNAGAYQVSACAGSRDRVCAQCTPLCAPGQYQTKYCDASSDIACRACSVCPPGQYASAPCTSVRDTQCSTCSLCPDGFYAEAGCVGDLNTVCSQCSVRPYVEVQGETYYKRSECTRTADTVFSRCQQCRTGMGGYGEFYTVQGCTATSNTVCAPCTTCVRGTYEVVACTAAQNRQCKICSGACNGEAYEKTPCGEYLGVAMDRACANCTVCSAREYMLSECGSLRDRVCRAKTSSCPSDAYLVSGSRDGTLRAWDAPVAGASR